MNNLTKYFVVLALGVVLQACADNVSPVQSSSNSLGTKNQLAGNVFLERVDYVIRMLHGENIDELRFLSVFQQVEARTLQKLIKKTNGRQLTFPVSERALAARELLTPERYSALEDACVIQLQSTNETIRVIAIRLLTKGLGSYVGKTNMLNTLAVAMKELERDDKLSVTPEVLFAVAEGLAYLDDSVGTEILESVLRSSDSPPYLKRRAIKAADYLGLSVSGGIATNLLLSEDAVVAYTALDSMESQYTNEVVFLAAITQLQRLQNSYANQNTFSSSQATLLLQAASIIKDAIRQDILSDTQRHEVKKAVNFLAGVEDENIQGRIGSLFAELAQDEDIELIQRLLLSNSARVRSRGALALSRCSKETIYEQKDVLLALLEDETVEVRNFSLYALRRGLGEQTGNYLSDAEFENQKVRVIERYSN